MTDPDLWRSTSIDDPAANTGVPPPYRHRSPETHPWKLPRFTTVGTSREVLSGLPMMIGVVAFVALPAYLELTRGGPIGWIVGCVLSAMDLFLIVGIIRALVVLLLRRRRGDPTPTPRERMAMFSRTASRRRASWTNLASGTVAAVLIFVTTHSLLGIGLMVMAAGVITSRMLRDFHMRHVAETDHRDPGRLPNS